MHRWDRLLSKIRRIGPTPGDKPTQAIDGPPDQPKSSPGPYRTDAPLNDPQLDLFDRAPFAHRVADTIGERSDPSSLVVGIYGPWGDGKTTVLNFIRERLRTYPSIITVTFNPWRMEGEQALLQGFFATLADALDRELVTSTEKVGDILRRYGPLLKVASGGLGDAVVGAGAALSTVSLDQLKDRVGGLLCEAGRRVVILMDDIDRLDRSEIQAIFRLVKLTGDFENTAYILAFDEQMVATAVGEKYASSSGKHYEAGISFLEKIVQVPLHLPPPASDALRQYCFELVEEALNESATKMDENQVNEFVRHFVDGVEIRLRTPRMAKRYANALHFSLAILKGETYTPDLLLVEGLRIFYPTLYDAIRRNPEAVLRTHSSDKGNSDLGTFIAAHTNGMTDQEKNAAANLVQALFPRTGTTILRSEWETEFARDQRIASNYYFPRYFTYGVSKSDVPDVQLKALMESLSLVGIEEASSTLGGLINEHNAGTVLFKLRSLEDNIEPTAASRLARVIARNGSRYPSPKSFVFFQQPLKQAAICISQLLRRIPPDMRGALSMEIVGEAETVLFACECVRWMSTSKDSKRDSILTTEEEQEVRTLLAKRIEAYMASLADPVHVAEPLNAAQYLGMWEWCSGPKAVSEYLSRQVTQHPETIFDLMKSYLPTGWGMTTGLPIETSFERDAYDSMTRTMDPETIAYTLRSKYGDQLKTPQFHLSNREPRELRLAHQFMFIYERVMAERQAKEANAADPGATTIPSVD